MPKFDIDVSIPGNIPGGPISPVVRRLPMIEARDVNGVLAMLQIKVFSHDQDNFVYEGRPGVLANELVKQSMINIKLSDFLVKEIGETRAKNIYRQIWDEVMTDMVTIKQ